MNTYFSRDNFKKNAKSYIMIVALLLISITFTILTDGIFINPRNISMLARQTTVVGFISLAMMFVILTGRIDLSVGTGLGMAGTIAAALQVWGDWSVPGTIIMVILIGVLMGAWNGFWVSYRSVTAFIATCGSMLIFRGGKLGIGNGMSIGPMKDSFKILGQGYVSENISWVLGIICAIAFAVSVIINRKSKIKYNIKQPTLVMDIAKVILAAAAILLMTYVFINYKGLPVPVVLLIVAAIICNFIANKTTFGRSIYAIGGNEEAAQLAGINTKRVVFLVYVLGGVLVAIAGMILTARLDAATAAAGDGMELDAIAACVVGGVAMAGGTGRVSGVIIGALVMSALNNGMSLINLENFWQFVVRGLVLLLAVWADSALNDKNEK